MFAGRLRIVAAAFDPRRGAGGFFIDVSLISIAALENKPIQAWILFSR